MKLDEQRNDHMKTIDSLDTKLSAITSKINLLYLLNNNTLIS